jgi:hypothetical protein
LKVIHYNFYQLLFSEKNNKYNYNYKLLLKIYSLVVWSLIVLLTASESLLGSTIPACPLSILHFQLQLQLQITSAVNAQLQITITNYF